MYAVERVHGRRMRGRRGGQMYAVERVHGRRMEGTNLSTQSSSVLAACPWHQSRASEHSLYKSQ